MTGALRFAKIALLTMDAATHNRFDRLDQPSRTDAPLIAFTHRRSDSPFVRCVWEATSREGGPFASVAYPEWEMVIAHVDDRVTLTVRGPETRATVAPCPPAGAWMGIRFRAGVSMPALATASLVDRAVTLPSAGAGRVWLAGEAREIPTSDNADVFVRHLLRAGLLVRDPVVQRVLAGERPPSSASVRSLQRRFLLATGTSRQTITATRRAHEATRMLREGASISHTIATLGFADQPHLTRTLRRLIGRTPAALRSRDSALQLSFIPPPDVP